MKKHFLLSFILMLSAFNILAQSDSNEVKKLEEFYTFDHKHFTQDTFLSSKVDTSFERFYYYAPQYQELKSNLGNVGTAQKDLFYQQQNQIGFKLNMDYLNDFRFTTSNNEYFNVSQPYADVRYINGAQSEEGINIRLAQNIRPQWNLGMEYRKISSEGFYLRQKSSINNFRIHQNFKSLNNRYGIIANYNYNDNNNQENGGLKYDSTFSTITDLSRKGFEVNFQNARSNGRNQEGYLEQFVNFGKTIKTPYKDENDSIYPDSIIHEYVVPSISLIHRLKFGYYEYGFEDYDYDTLNYLNPDTNLHGRTISDFTKMNTLRNDLGIKFSPFRSASPLLSNTGVEAYGGIETLSYFQQNAYTATTLNDQNLENMIVGLALGNYSTDKYFLRAGYETVISGFDAGDNRIYLKSTTNMGKLSINVDLESSLLNPDLIFRNYASTLVSWNNSELAKIKKEFAKVELAHKKFNTRIGVQVNNIQGHTYFNDQTEVKQFSGSIDMFQVYLKSKLNVWLFHLDVDLRYQSQDNNQVINLPEFVSYSSFYLESTLFKKDMVYRIGADLYYASDYTGDSYNPMTRQYEVQTNTVIESYPWLEVFAMVKVDRAYFFGKLSNALEGSVPYTYFAAPGYPMPDRAFKFGIKWEFIN